MALTDQLTWIHVNTSLENLRRILPDTTKSTDVIVFIDGVEVGEFNAWDSVTRLCKKLRKAFPGRFGFVIRTTEPAEANYIKLGDRSLWVTENGDGTRIRVTTYSADEEYHKREVTAVKADLHRVGIQPVKGTCVFTFREEC